LFIFVIQQNVYTMQFQTASRKKAKIKLGLSAVSGGGKTYSALLIAFGITGDWSKIGVIDTENKSAELYSHLGNYQTLPLEAPYSPERYIEAIKAGEKAGFEVIIIDSITHEWDGKGGIIDISNSMSGNSFTNWAKLTPRHQAFIDTILQSPCHIITTVRRKQDYEMTKDSSGKLQVQKAGLKEVTREGYEYELTVNLELDQNHNATSSKDRTGLFAGKPHFTPSAETGKLIKQWCESGIEVPKPAAWSLSPSLAAELETLINNSTLDANGRVAATNRVTNAKNDAEIKVIEEGLRKLQVA
jgi:hypothetical protein